MGAIWKGRWQFLERKFLRQERFAMYQRTQRFWNRCLNDLERCIGEVEAPIATNEERASGAAATGRKQDNKKSKSASKLLFAFGSAGSKGEFMRLRGCGFKGPVAKFSKFLALHHSVVMVSEYRTSKLCWKCGDTLSHPRNRPALKKMKEKGSKARHAPENSRVSYCAHRDHPNMLHRDDDACLKIGLRFLGRLLRLPLGPWENLKKSDPAYQHKPKRMSRRRPDPTEQSPPQEHLMNIFRMLNLPPKPLSKRSIRSRVPGVKRH